MSKTKDGGYYHMLADLADQLEEEKGDVVYRNKMEAVSSTLPSKQAQYSTVGIKLKRREITDERAKLTKRKSTIKLNQVEPDQSEVQDEMKKRGLKASNIHTQKDEIKMMQMIRAVPRPIPIKQSMKQLLLQGPIKPSKGFKYRIKHNWKKFKISWNEFTYSLEVWKGSIKKIEGHQGTGVVSYFVFLRWLFFLNFFIFLLCFWVITFFQVAFTEADYDKDTMGVDDSGSFPGVATAETCSDLYKPNVTTDALSLVLDFIQGTGWMETTAMFYGYYTNKELTLAASEYNMPLAYFLTALVVLLVSLIFMLRNTVSSFKEAQIAKSSKQSVYCNAVFAGWDYSIIEDEATIIKQKSLYRGLCAEIEEQRFQMKRTSRTTEEKCKLYTVRFLINFLIVIMLGGAGAAIYFAQDFSTSFTTSSDAANYHSLVLLLVEFLPSIVIGLCNGIYPLIFGILVNFEEYRPAFVIKISLVRQVFLRLASLAILIVSLYIQITCNTQNFCLVGTGDCPAIQCWETYVGSAIYKLLVMDFFIDVGVTLGVELPRKLITTKCECGLLNKVGPAEFDIPKNVLDLVYAQILCWLGFFFAPLVPAICVFRFFVLFYLKKLSALFNTVPPEKPYQASKSNSFFMFILLVAYFMICIPVGYVLVRMDPSPMCGPFRIYDTPLDILDIQISNSPNWFQVVWEVITNTAVVAGTIVVLILLIYYCSALNSAHKDLIEMMREQLILEGKDKQFLLAKLADVTGEGRKKAPAPQLRTVNEIHKTIEQPLYGKEKTLIPLPKDDGAPPPPRYDAPPIAKNGPKYDPPNKRDLRDSPTKSYENLDKTARSNGIVSASQVIPDNQFIVKSNDNTAENNISEW